MLYAQAMLAKYAPPHCEYFFYDWDWDDQGEWRIAPASGPLTEATFQKMPLPFEGKSSLRWGGKTGKQMYFDATYVSEGTTPAGSTWAMNPLREPNLSPFPLALCGSVR